MSRAAARAPLALALGRCLRRAALPGIAVTGLGYGGAVWFGPRLGPGLEAAGVATGWLGLPLLAIAAVVAATAILLWPTFAARRPGADWVLRLQPGPLRGIGAVIAGALAAQLVLTLPITTLVARGLGAPAAAAARHELPAPGSQPWLVARDPLLVYDIDLAAEIAAIEVRPLTAPPTGPLEPSLVDVRTPAGDLLGAAIPFDQNGQSARIDLAPQTLPRLELALAGGNVPLFFPAGAVVVVEAAPRSGLANGCIAAALMLLPTFVALAVACLCGAVAAPPTVLTVAFAVIFLLTVGGLGPGDSTLLALLRGDWLPSTGIFAASASSLAAGSVAMIAAMLLRRRLHR